MVHPEATQGLDPGGGFPVPGPDSPIARGFAAATAQIDMALREAQQPIDALGGSLERISGELAVLRALSLRSGSQLDAESRRTLDAALAGLGVQLTTAVQSLQFYDRLFQHLSHVHDFLFGAADLFGEPVGTADDPAGDAALRWEQLRERLFRRLLSDAQRQLLDVVLPPRHWRDGPGGSADAAPPIHDSRTPASAAQTGGIELF
jgi:hypothetical protein